jgi:hypothetical protein
MFTQMLNELDPIEEYEASDEDSDNENKSLDELDEQSEKEVS